MNIAKVGVRLSDVSLHCARVPYLGVVRVQARSTAGSALVEQVPALVERYLEGLEARTLGLRRLPSTLTFPKLMLFSSQLVDAVDEQVILHR
jgi:hypothetical protein